MMETIAGFEFATAQRILFGPGKLAELPSHVRSKGDRVLLVTGSDPDRHTVPIRPVALFSVKEEPSVPVAIAGADLARREGVDVVVAIGGGSVIDAGKAIAALAANPGDPLDYLEVVGKGLPLPAAPLPFVAVPTTAGTGAEVTRNAVLSVPEARVKVSLRSPLMLPDIALVDPALTHALPVDVTATTGMDALTQLIEPFLCTRSHPITDALCRDGIARAARALPLAVREPQNAAARADMALASLFGGLALANSGLGAVHGFAGPMGGMFAAPHGALCAALLPHVLRTNLQALETRASRNPVLARFDEVARLLTGQSSATAPDAIDFCAHLAKDLKIPSIATYGVTTNDLDDIVAKASRASSMKPNPIELTETELHRILEAALQGS